MAAVIPPVKTGKSKERTAMNCISVGTSLKIVFRALKRWRGIAAHCAKLAASFIAAVSCQVFVPLPSSPHCLGSVDWIRGKEVK
ncbi:hypothetical protein [Treponema endosymbiont of Eucomonympha sp.]|uniref:hypothetical protein n=1 Tax=Treponema endosymbiont of Eucomonympha sp. TaxID=1580831 RepID=UPI000751583B|nr:hypothetical protein [Treponema endosymbiont of Eucomonympha sp.]